MFYIPVVIKVEQSIKFDINFHKINFTLSQICKYNFNLF